MQHQMCVMRLSFRIFDILQFGMSTQWFQPCWWLCSRLLHSKLGDQIITQFEHLPNEAPRKKVEPPESSETYPLAILRACKSLLWYGLLSSIIYLWTMMILHSYVKLPKAIPHQLSCGPYPVSSVLPGLSIHGKVLHVLSSLPRKLSGPSNNHHVWVISPDIVSENIGQNPWNYAREEATRAINVTLLPAYPPVISHDYGNNHGPLCFDDFPLK